MQDAARPIFCFRNEKMKVHLDNDHVPYDYYEVALITAEGNVVGAALGSSDAERKGRAIAIWKPSDAARVREACGGKSQ